MSAHNEHSHAQDPKKESLIYLATLITLIILTGVTFGASYVNFGSGGANIVIALSIATVKAVLVSLFFMHLIHDRPINSVIAIAGFLFLGILLLFTFLDVGTRNDLRPRNMKAPEASSPSATPAPAADHRKE